MLADTSLQVNGSGEGGEAWQNQRVQRNILEYTRKSGENTPHCFQKHTVLVSLGNLHNCDFRFLGFSVVHTQAFYYKSTSRSVSPGWPTKK